MDLRTVGRPGTSSAAGALMLAEALRPVRGFDDVSRQVLDYLNASTGLDVWAVTRVAGGHELVLSATEATEAVPLEAGQQFPFEETMCRQVVAGAADRINPDVRAVPALAQSVKFGDDHGIRINSYVGTPIVRTDGSLFGTLCGFGSKVQPERIKELEPLLDLLSSLLSTVLEADTVTSAAVREAEQARKESEVDALTGLLNRRGWDRLVEHEETRFRRFGDPASVIMLDLDRLKIINDTEGHEAGDRYLQQAATVLTEQTRNTDIVARLGGDEFGIIAVDTHAEHIAAVVNRLERRLAEVGVSGSIGHAPFTVMAGFSGAQRAADAMMYERKRERRNEWALAQQYKERAAPS